MGAGAAGTWAAARAARAGARVLLLEKTPRIGTKVLASGGTRCNLTTTLASEAAGRLFGREGGRFLRPAFRALSPAALRERFGSLGVETVEAPLEKVFPASQRARDVRDALEAEARAAGVLPRCGAAVAGIESLGAAGGWRARLAGAGAVRCRRLVLCTGGASVPRSGTTGDAYPWLRELGLEVVEPRPALVPLRSGADWVRELAGVALQEVEARLVAPTGETVRRRRPVVFTHEGLSGPAALDLSRHVTADGGAREILLDLGVGTGREELRRRLIEGAASPGAGSVARALGLDVPRRVLDAACRQAGLVDSRSAVSELPRARRHDLVEALKGLAVPVEGSLGFDRAEVTAGGLALAAVDPATMAVRGHPGLWVCGELLDLDGPIGGLNFQAAFATAELAGRAVASEA
ncbi:MAG: aminoacetone oxidase family FAD-binding enzyme [Planctomycetota bacterium]|nr:aminoacetone oxidase family FAD-binding enzyme [Planctomycetota bacterium]MDP6762354.1 aminoacetone oxidase family FAD-binding enzyme [Planctomycetota bacterium]MDP6990029.1 aminoacetone oxidase family FAD-binding enzyme [Planctomycetota bacterium]